MRQKRRRRKYAIVRVVLDLSKRKYADLQMVLEEVGGRVYRMEMPKDTLEVEVQVPRGYLKEFKQLIMGNGIVELKELG